MHSALKRSPRPGIGRIPDLSKHPSEAVMSKGMDQKKTEKKKPEKTLKEKRAAKAEKKKNK